MCMVYVYIHICKYIYIYIWWPPKTYLLRNFNSICSVLLNILASKIWGIFWWSKIVFFPTLFPSHNSLRSRIQDSRSQKDCLNLESKGIGFKIQEVFLGSWILNPIRLDSRSFLGILNLESWILSPWIQEVFLRSWIMNLESYPLGFKRSFWHLESWIQRGWIEEVVSEPWILNLES